MTTFKHTLPGFMLALGFAVPAWFLGAEYRLIGGPVFAILLGMLVATLFHIPNVFGPGFRFTSKKILQLSIVLIGFSMNLSHVLTMGARSLVIILAVLLTSFGTAYVLRYLLKTEENVTILIGVGTAICGGSAIAATAPVIRANDREIASAISTIFLFNIIAVLLFPSLGRLMDMTETAFGMWAGTAINDTSSVVAAGQIWSEGALQTATIVKLVRTLMIIPVVLILGILQTRKMTGEKKLKKSERHVSNPTIRQRKDSYVLLKVFPWFVLLFLAASLLTTMNVVTPDGARLLASAGRFFIVTAMAAIGLNTNLKQLAANGVRPLLLGMGCWVAVAVVSLGVQYLIQ
ncbi:MAG: YeiH family protein [Bacillota bacterium]|nr:YeiH family protein [Bacillota bacterium]MDW7676413.1 YeiH family protein [Bacillota bacterium]